MSDIKKLQEAFELLLNEEDEAADDIMRQYFLSLARKINEEFEDSELEETDLSSDMEDDLTHEIESDMDEIDAEEGVIEAEDEDEENMDMEMDVDMDMEDDEAVDDLEVDMDTELGDDALTNLEDAIEQLQAVFDELSGEEGVEDDEDMDMEYDDEDYDSEEVDFDLEADDDGDVEGEMDYEADEEDLDESVDLQKVSIPSNKEGQEVGKGGSFQTNTQQSLKPKGQLKGTDATPNISKGGEAKGYKDLDKQGGEKVKGDLTNVDNVVSSSKTVQKKQAPEGKGEKEVGKGKSVPQHKKSVISTKVR